MARVAFLSVDANRWAVLQLPHNSRGSLDMTTELLEQEISRFLRSSDPEVLCLRGAWGIGKTYSWHRFLQQAKERDAIALKSYAYVSLFGLESLDQLKYAIFENMVPTTKVGIEPTLDSLKENAAAAFKLGGKSVPILQRMGLFKGFTELYQASMFLAVRGYLICIDDIERKGDKLSTKDILGLISHLRDRRACKIMLILNENELDKADKEQFELYNEKTIDASLTFEPTPEDCAHIAVTGDTKVDQMLRANVIALGISNIRVIRKVQRLVSHVMPLLGTFSDTLRKQAVQTLTLLGWSCFGRGGPTVDYIQNKRGHALFRDDKKDMSAEEKAWNALLDDYDFLLMDELDNVLLEGIQRGYFDAEKVAKAATSVDAQLQASSGAFSQAWRLYHDSFDDNQAETVKAIIDGFKKDVKFITPINLNGAVRLLKDLGHPAEALELLQLYMEERKDERKLFDLDDSMFGGDVDDPEVRAAFIARHQSFTDDRSPAEVLTRVSKNKNWSESDATLLATLSAGDFYTLFKTARERQLARMIEGALLFRRHTNPTPEEARIVESAVAALREIAAESPINRRRVALKYEVDVPDKEAGDS